MVSYVGRASFLWRVMVKPPSHRRCLYTGPAVGLGGRSGGCAQPPSRAQATPSAGVGRGARMHLSGDRANRATDVASVVEADPARGARNEVHAVGVVRVRLNLRGRPVVAVGAGTVEVGNAADARCK